VKGSDDSPSDRIRTLLLRGDNMLKSARHERFGRALEAFEEAREVAAHPEVDARVRELVERRIARTLELIDEGK
jgi:tRNA threonylcarbamoyladenosine modification (KEOPS) complex Cgi121 subunit